MARSIHDTLLPLDVWANLMQIDPYTFNQWGVGFPEGSKIGIGTGCRDVFYQFGWQFDALSRDEIALAIQRAEDMLAKALTFYPAPKWIVQEQIQFPSRRRNHYPSYGLNAWSMSEFGSGYPHPYHAMVQTRYHKVWGGGTLARTLIGDTANLTLSDSDGDGINDTFTVTIVVAAGTDANELGVYFRAADRVPTNDAVAEQWRIRPVTVTVSGTTATITGHSTLLAKPVLETIVDPEPLDVTVAGNYVAQVTVYRVYRDTENSGSAFWELLENCTDTPCTLEEQAICVGDRNARMGQLFIGYDDSECCTHWRAPDKVTINYLAGEALAANGQMQPEMAQYVAHLATGLLASFTCGCDRVRKIIDFWRFDASTAAMDQGGRALTPHEAESPFGYSRGALFVWNRIADTQQITGVSV